MKDSKNQIIRSMKSYEEGGSTTEGCFDGGRGRSRGKGCHKVTKYGHRGVPEGVKKVLKGVGAAAVGTAAYVKREAIKAFAKDKLGLKKGGSVKMQKGGGIMAPVKSRKMTVNTIPVKKSKYTTPSRKTPMAQNGGTANSMPADAAKRIASSARSGVDNMNTNTTQGQKLNMARPTPNANAKAASSQAVPMSTDKTPAAPYKKGGTAKRKMQVGGVAKRPTLSARIKPVVKAVKTVKATVKRRG
jgi:hypothetical protein